MGRPQKPSAVYIEHELHIHAEEFEYLESRYDVVHLNRVPMEAEILLYHLKTDLVVLNPITLIRKDKGVGFVKNLRCPLTPNSDTPIIVYSVLSDERIIRQLQNCGVVVIHSPDTPEFKKTIDSLL